MPVQNLYDEVVRVTYVYLGPAADRFVSRQITNHLDKQPELLLTTDLPELISWIKLAMGFLTEDVTIIADYTARLEALQQRHTNDHGHNTDRATTKNGHTTTRRTDYAGEIR